MGREVALRRGANVLMPILTPTKYREHYTLYEGELLREVGPPVFVLGWNSLGPCRALRAAAAMQSLPPSIFRPAHLPASHPRQAVHHRHSGGVPKVPQRAAVHG